MKPVREPAPIRAALLLSLASFSPSASVAEEAIAPGAIRMTIGQEVSIGGMARVTGRDPGLVGGGNGGTGTSVNYDDGSLNYGRGLIGFGAQGRTTFAGEWNSTEIKLEAVYFYDFMNADGQTDFHSLSEDARDRAGRYLYLNEAYVGYGGQVSDAAFSVRLGTQILRWSASPWFGYSIAPVNPISASRRYQPGNTARDSFQALPMLSGRIETASKWTVEGFYLFRFEPSESEASGTFLSPNDFYSPGGRYLQLGQGSPLVPDADASVITPATPFGSRVPRGPDRRPESNGQFGARIETPELGAAKLAVAGYAMRVHSREPLVSVISGTLGGLLHVTAPDYASSGSYFVDYPAGVNVLGASLRSSPAKHTRASLEYSRRFGQPLQIDDELLITAGLAPAAALGACTPNPASALCAGTLAALNRNALIAARGGITAANAASFLSTEMRGYERFDVSQYSASLQQGLPAILGAKQGVFTAEVGGVHVHGFRPDFIDAIVSVRPDASGARRVGLATASSWGYRVVTRLDYQGVLGMQSVSPSFVWIQDVKGNAPITMGTLLEGTRTAIVAVDFGITKSLAARVSYRAFVNRGNNADRFSDRDFVQFSVTKRF